MKRRRVMVILTGVILAGGLVVFLWPSEREPEYQGKKLSEWLLVIAEFEEQPESSKAVEAVQAVRSIGTNATPFLVRWMRYERPRWKNWVAAAYHKLPSRVRSDSTYERLAHDQSEDRREMAVFGFLALGPAGRGAVPELVRELQTARARQAIICLYGIGTGARPAIPDLIGLLTNSDQNVRWSAANAIERIAPEMLLTNGVSQIHE